MNLDLDILLAGFGDEEPSGPDLEYDPLFSDMTIAATARGEQQVGDTVLPAEEADFAEVQKVACQLLEKTMDLRVAVHLAEAGLNRDGFVSFAMVLDYIKRALEGFWDTVHPQLDADDDDDPTERLNALVGLVDDETVLRQLRRAPLTDSKMMGRFSLRHISIAKGDIIAPADMENPPDMAGISAAFKDTPEEEMTAIRQSLDDALTLSKEIDAILADRVPGQGPDLSPMNELIVAAQRAVADSLGEAVSLNDDGADAEAGDVENGGGGSNNGGGVGGINSTNDVLRAMDLINDYYQRNEPSSPVPIFVNRARRLVAADFMTIMKDMAATGVDEVRRVGGITDDY